MASSHSFKIIVGTLKEGGIGVEVVRDPTCPDKVDADDVEQQLAMAVRLGWAYAMHYVSTTAAERKADAVSGLRGMMESVDPATLFGDWIEANGT